MFWTFVILAWTLLHVYVFVRAASVPWIARNVSRRALAAIGAVLWGSVFLLRTFGHDGSGAVARAVELIGMTWLAVLFLIAVCLLVVDVITGFGLVLRGTARALRGRALVAGLALSVIALVQGVRPPVVREYGVPIAGLPLSADGTVLVAISDLHVGGLLGRDWLAARVTQVVALHGDIVVLLGDVFEGHGQPDVELVATLRGLSAPHGVFAVTGNHESHGGYREGSRALEDAGFTVLHDRWVEVRPGLVLAGVDDLTSRHRSGLDGDPIARALAGRPVGAVVLLSHTPWDAEEASRLGAGLMLAGHTHDGQIWPFDVLVRTVYPLMGGRYEVAGMPVIVCRGTGTWGPRMRLWRPAEILRITLRATQSGQPSTRGAEAPRRP